MSQQRDLNDRETRALEKLTLWETLVMRRAIVATIGCDTALYLALLRLNIVRPIKTAYNHRSMEWTIVLTLADYWRYLWRCCKEVGFTVEIDGTIRTQDSMTVDRNIFLP